MTISIIIPTHNRSSSVERLLKSLSSQTYPASLIEVVVAADGCTDNTREIVNSFKAPFTLKYVSQVSQGAGTARNNGSSMATGKLLLFLDDDIEPSPGLVEAHVKMHVNENCVVVGYLPMEAARNEGFFRISLRDWWENKFYAMSDPGYRYCYEDLTSGNFSISSRCFSSLNGFNTQFRCREDYELGVRLISSKVQFIYCREAWGYHRDYSTDLKRSLKRKIEEAEADIHFARCHPKMLPKLRFTNFKAPQSRFIALLFLFAFNAKKIGDCISLIISFGMNIFEWCKMRKLWHKLNIKLHQYWYIRGITKQIKNLREFQKFLHDGLSFHREEVTLFDLDLQRGMLQAEQELDKYSPSGINILFGDQKIGSIAPIPGAEAIKGVHLRSILTGPLSIPLTRVLVFEQLISKQNVMSSK